MNVADLVAFLLGEAIDHCPPFPCGVSSIKYLNHKPKKGISLYCSLNHGSESIFLPLTFYFKYFNPRKRKEYQHN